MSLREAKRRSNPEISHVVPSGLLAMTQHNLYVRRFSRPFNVFLCDGRCPQRSFIYVPPGYVACVYDLGRGVLKKF